MSPVVTLVGMSDVTQILQQIEAGDPSASDELLPLVYDELRKLAAARLAAEKPGQTLQPTALVHEAYLRLVDCERVQHWNSRGHFFAAAAESIRRILFERARSKKRLKRGGDSMRADLFEHDVAVENTVDEVLIINDSLDRLGESDPIAAEVLKLKFYGGLTIEEAGDVLGMSRATAYRHWAYARAWVRAEVLGDKSGKTSRK